MSIKLFSDFLYENGKLTKEQINEAITYQSKNNISLSSFALNKGVLSKDDLNLITKDQKVQDQKFVNMVLETTLLNTKQLEDLLNKYNKKHISFSEALIEKELISENELENQLNSFYKDQKKLSRHIYKEMAFFDRDKLIEDSINILEKLYLKNTQQIIQLKKIEFCSDSIEDKTIVTQSLNGEESIEYAIVLEDMINLKISKDSLISFLNDFLLNMAVNLVSKEIEVSIDEAKITNGSKIELDGYYKLIFLTQKGDLSLYIKI